MSTIKPLSTCTIRQVLALNFSPLSKENYFPQPPTAEARLDTGQIHSWNSSNMRTYKDLPLASPSPGVMMLPWDQVQNCVPCQREEGSEPGTISCEALYHQGALCEKNRLRNLTKGNLPSYRPGCKRRLLAQQEGWSWVSSFHIFLSG